MAFDTRPLSATTVDGRKAMRAVEMPLAKHAGHIARRLHRLRQRELACAEAAVVPDRQQPHRLDRPAHRRADGIDAVAWSVLPREQTCPARSANRRSS